MEIRYLSHGKIETGGYRNEFFFANQLQKKFPESVLKILRQNKTYRGFRHLSLQWWAWKNSVAEINIVVSRLALAAILKNLFSKNKVFIMLHNFDDHDAKSLGLKIYYSLLFFVLRIYKSRRIKVVTGAPFFKNYFEKRFERPILLFPNFFNTEFLGSFKTNLKQNKIHLGQWSEKNSLEVFILAAMLKERGYSSYFSTLNSDLKQADNRFQIIYFESYESYLQAMAESKFTIAFPTVNEGWNRVAHESVLTGTTVIGFEKGGLGNLLHEANMLIVSNAQQALELILENRQVPIDMNFNNKYDIGNSMNYLEEIIPGG